MFLVFLLLCLTRVSSCSYVSPGAMEKSKLRSSGEQKNVFWFFLIDFIYENDLVALGEKFAKKRGRTRI